LFLKTKWLKGVVLYFGGKYSENENIKRWFVIVCPYYTDEQYEEMYELNMTFC